MSKNRENARVKESSKIRSNPAQDRQHAQKKDADGKKEKRESKIVPISFYWIKDYIRQFLRNKNFPDAMAATFAVASVALAFPLFPLPILIAMLAITFVITIFSPLLGLMALLFETFPMFIYQSPLLAWILTIFITIALFLGYKHYRTITLIYLLAVLPLSYLGYLLEFPALIVGILFVGLKRGSIAAVATVLVVVMLSGLTGIQNTGPIAYNASAAHAILAKSEVASLFVPNKAMPTISGILPALSGSISNFFSFSVSSHIFDGFALAFTAISYNGIMTGIQAMVWLFVVFSISNYVIKSRSPYKGAESSILGVIIPIVYIAISYITNTPYTMYILWSFVITPFAIFSLEINNVDVVRALEVMKQDFLGKFGESFEDFSSGSRETLNDIANYDETKKELKEAILAPIEHREISGAYNVRPTKGILLFGPPGTGKTLLMRVISNEIRARFFYIRTSSILSPYSGEGAQVLAKIFNTAKKNKPAVLFFDEIDAIASSREMQESESTRQLLSTLLSEMDGFQKSEGIVVVGATNIPHVLDPGIMRPGRFDKIIYMPLPDKKGREEIFRYYLKKLPVSENIEYQKLAEITERFSGADIKNICDESARQVADVAVSQVKVLKITTDDLITNIKRTKPSTSLSQIDTYNNFRLDYERRSHPEKVMRDENAVMINDVIGLNEAKNALKEAVEMPLLHQNMIKRYDISAIKGILLFGPPGTGKTMLMKAVANEMGDVNMIVISGPDVQITGPESATVAIKQIFERAKENSPSILFIDEIDAIVPSREGASEIGLQMTSQFLQEMDGIKESSGIVIVGATNRPDALDPALLRAGRFDKLIFVPQPSEAERTKLFERYLKKAPIAKIDFEELARKTEGFTGADIANICREVKMKVMENAIKVSEDREITMEDMLLAMKEIKPSATEREISRYKEFISRYGKR